MQAGLNYSTQKGIKHRRVHGEGYGRQHHSTLTHHLGAPGQVRFSTVISGAQDYQTPAAGPREYWPEHGNKTIFNSSGVLKSPAHLT